MTTKWETGVTRVDMLRTEQTVAGAISNLPTGLSGKFAEGCVGDAQCNVHGAAARVCPRATGVNCPTTMRLMRPRIWLTCVLPHRFQVMGSKEMIRLLIAGDHKLFRQGLRLLLAECGDLAIVAETSNYAETLAAVRQQELDLAILDLSTPGRDGIEIVAHIRSIQPSMKTLVLSTRSTQSTLMRALNVSLDGFMAKESGVEELVGAIHHLAYGEPVLARYIG